MKADWQGKGATEKVHRLFPVQSSQLLTGFMSPFVSIVFVFALLLVVTVFQDTQEVESYSITQ